MNLAIIPARGGSKRILKKNIKIFNGKPAIAYSIEAAIKSKIFDKIIVSTDDKKISKIANKYGAETPFFRPKEISDDYTPSNIVIKHSINYFKKKNILFKNVCCIYPVAPFISYKDIRKAYNILIRKKWNFVITASKSPFKIDRSFTKNVNQSIQMRFPSLYKKRSQDLKNSYYDVGQFYWGKQDSWLKYNNLFKNYSTILELPFLRAIDIDDLDDWKNAEFISKNIFNFNQNLKSK